MYRKTQAEQIAKTTSNTICKQHNERINDKSITPTEKKTEHRNKLSQTI